MDYASLNKATVRFTLDDHDYETERVSKPVDKDILSVELKSRSFFQQYDSGYQFKCFAHFEMTHWHFWRLHCAISYTNEYLIKLLVKPNLKASKVARSPAVMHRVSYTLDHEYQLQALKNMISCKPGVPYLLLGPFGTGKTHVLAAAVEQLLKNPQNRVLVCTHQNTAADKLYLSLQESLHPVQTAKHVLRVVPDDQGTLRNFAFMQPYSCEAVHKINIRRLSKWPVIITTFSTALTIKDKHEREGGTLSFSTIIVDEGAQSREPEALGALVLANSNTRIIIAGDHQQV